MSIEVSIREPLGQRQALLPLLVGGAGADLQVPGDDVSQLRIDADGRQWLLRAMGEATVVINGSAQHSPATLTDHDVIRVGDAQLVVQPGAARIDVLHLAGNATVAPVHHHALPGEEVVASVREIIAAGAGATAMNRTSRGTPRRRGGSIVRRTGLALFAAAVVAAAWVLLSLVPVGVQITPAAATVKVQHWLSWHTSDRIFMLPGRRQIEFTHPGYRSQRLTLEVSRALGNAAALPVTLALLPGLLTVNTQGEAAELLVDGKPVGKVPGEVELEHGPRDLIVRAPRRIDFVTRIEIEGGGARQTLDVQLQPSTGWLVLDTLPAAATVRIDDAAHGAAPQRLELDAGLHRLSITAAGRRNWNSQIAIIAGQTLDLGRIDLALPAPVVAQAVENPAAEAGDSSGALAAAQVEPPRPPPPPPARLQSALLGTLILMPAGSFQQGSDRREQGRRANEVQRMVTLTRPFYLAETEVSNAQFHAFKANHLAGTAMEKSLDLDSQAVSNISWDDAVEFCNWLSLREGLPPSYERREARWQLVQPLNTGYRLPTEAEWEYAARYVDGRQWLRYVWGDSLPPPAGGANLAGQEYLPTKPGPDLRLATAIPEYRDEHPVIGPVDSYQRSKAGFLNLGGNVSEWMSDVYASMPELGPVTDPAGQKTEGPHSIRGASWRTSAIAELRLAWRERASGPAPTIGFRVARFAEVKP